MARMLWTAALGLLLAAPAAAQDAGEPSTIWDEGNGREQWTSCQAVWPDGRNWGRAKIGYIQ